MVAVAGGCGVGDDADLVVVAAAAHADVEVLAGGRAVGKKHSPIDGDTFGFVDGDGVGESDVVGGVVGGEDDAAPSVEVGNDIRSQEVSYTGSLGQCEVSISGGS